jgi:hypothetical protein
MKRARQMRFPANNMIRAPFSPTAFCRALILGCRFLVTAMLAPRKTAKIKIYRDNSSSQEKLKLKNFRAITSVTMARERKIKGTLKIIFSKVVKILYSLFIFTLPRIPGPELPFREGKLRRYAVGTFKTLTFKSVLNQRIS